MDGQDIKELMVIETMTRLLLDIEMVIFMYMILVTTINGILLEHLEVANTIEVQTDGSHGEI